MKRIIGCFLLSLGLAAVSFAQEPADSLQQVSREVPAGVQAPGEQTAEQLWDKANTAYINGDFHAAADAYEELLSRGVSSMKLYYNLGNAYFKDDRIGKAILYYNRALRLAPGNDDIRYNLSVAEARTKDNIEDIPEFFFVTWMRDIRHTMGCTAWSLLSLALLACMLGLFLVYLLAQRISLRKQIRESQNAALVRGKRANKVAVQRFRVAKRYMEEQNRHAFYEEMLRALWGYMGDKFNIPVANLTKENVREELHKRGVSAEESQRFTSIITKCDEAQ